MKCTSGGLKRNRNHNSVLLLAFVADFRVIKNNTEAKFMREYFIVSREGVRNTLKCLASHGFVELWIP